MKTEYKHIKFVQTVLNGCWNCLNRESGDVLGSVSYYKPWRQFVFEPDELGDIIFNSSCLRDIAHFLNQLNEKRGLSPSTCAKKTKSPRTHGTGGERDISQ